MDTSQGQREALTSCSRFVERVSRLRKATAGEVTRFVYKGGESEVLGAGAAVGWMHWFPVL